MDARRSRLPGEADDADPFEEWRPAA